MNKPLSTIQKLFLPSIFDLIVMTVFSVMILADPMIKCFDIFWHLRTGDLLLAGIFPSTDIFSYTAYGKSWILHEWGSQVIFAFIYNLMGIPGLIVLKSFIYALMYGLMFKLMLNRHLNIFICLGFTLLLMLGTVGGWTVRPHMFTNLFLVVLIWIYDRFRQQKNTKILWVLPVLFLCWINLHGGFIIGFIFLGVCISAGSIHYVLKSKKYTDRLVAQIKPLIKWSLLSFAACFINPNTYKGVLYPLMYLGGQMDSKLIQEWGAPSMHTDIHFFVYISVILLGLMFQQKKLHLHEIFLVMVFTLFAFSARRHLAVFAIVITPFVAGLWQANITALFNTLQTTAEGLAEKWLIFVKNYVATRSEWFFFMEKRLFCHLLPLFVIMAMTGASFTFPEKLHIGLDKTRYPVEIVEHIKSHDIQGNIFNQYGWGGFLLWTLPEKKVFIDGRMDVYKRDFSDLYKTIIDLENGWELLIENFDIQHILVGNEKPIARFLVHLDEDWILEKETGKACFLSKRQ